MVHTVERNFSLFDQDQPFSFWLKICAISCISINSYANSDDADPYLSEKIDVAVEAASESGLPDVGHIWYNRSTANSFNLPKMLTTEMDKLHIEGAMGPTAAGQAAEAEKLKPVADVALDKIDKSEIYESIFNQIAGGSGLLVPNKEAVRWLRDVQRAVSKGTTQKGTTQKGTTQKGSSSIRAPWFDSLIAFHDPLTEPEAGKASQADSSWSQSSRAEGKHPRNKRRMIEEQSMSNANMKASLPEAPLSHLDRLEAESIHIMREVMAHAENPVMLYSIGKDSSVMLHLARKAFFPSTPPFPLLHVDTRWKFRAMYEFREKMAQESGMELLVHINPDGVAKNINPFDHGSALHTDIMKTEGLKQALDAHQFDVAFGGARRDEEKSRAKERIFSFRNQAHRWDPKNQRPELWNLYNCRKNPGESIRVFPLSNWTELDIWQYIYRENISIVPLYFAAERPVVERNGMLIMVDDDRMQLLPDEKITSRRVRFRTLGCYPLTGAIDSQATDLADIVLELLQSTTSERQGRAIDTDSSGSMEKKKQEGYF